jgi:hypothetical protein
LINPWCRRRPATGRHLGVVILTGTGKAANPNPPCAIFLVRLARGAAMKKKEIR